jgi:DNA-binding NtrC family response regulator
MRKASFVLAPAVVLLFACNVAGQSLADVARAEEARRKTVKGQAKVYTNDSLRGADGGEPPAAPQSQPPAATPASDAAAKPGASLATMPAAPPSTNSATDEKYWRDRLTTARDALRRSQTFVDALQSQINALYTEFVAEAARRHRRARPPEGRHRQTDQGHCRYRRRGSPRERSGRLAPLTPPRRVPFSILLVEDKDSLRMMLKLAIEGHGHVVVEARDQGEAIRAMQQHRPALVLTDLRLPEGDGFGVLRAAKELDPELPVIVMTAYGSIQDAVAAMKEGALDFLAKPVDPDHLMLMVERALTQRRVMTEYILLKEELATRRGAPQIIGDAPSLKQSILSLQRAAGSDATVLLEGESGTGKELFARALHALSPRSEGPFVAINCAAIPDNLLETELFGHEKGAFTGAVARKPGKFELAHHGTLFLDEIGDLPLALQAKILRALEERRFERVGGTQSLHVDVRIVAATNKQLRAGVAAKQFREDLFFRLSVFPILIPPLRDRPDDIPILARHFAEKFSRELKKKAAILAPSAIEELQKYHWPGNVRELQNCMERAVILSESDTIHGRHLNLSLHAPLPPETPSPWSAFDLSGTLADVLKRAQMEVEKRKIEHALKEGGGDKGRAADLLALPYRHLLAKMKDYGLQ